MSKIQKIRDNLDFSETESIRIVPMGSQLTPIAEDNDGFFNELMMPSSTKMMTSLITLTHFPTWIKYLENMIISKFLLIALCITILFSSCNKFSSDNKVETDTTDTISSQLNAETIYQHSILKIAMIISYRDGIPFSQGSGFFIGKNTLVTNFHCIDGAQSIELKIAGYEAVFKGPIIEKASEKYDLAIIKTKQDFPFLAIDSIGNENIGSKIYVIGNPRGLEGTISDGILSGKRNNEDVEYLQITAPISPGNSGGPVLNEKGDVIGVSTFTFRNGQNLNFAMPIKYIAKCEPYDAAKYASPKRKIKRESDAVSLTTFNKEGSEFAEHMTLKNNSQDNITFVSGVLVYRTMDNEILDYQVINKNVYIPVGLSKRIKVQSFDDDQNWEYYKEKDFLKQCYNLFKVEFRLLSYEIEE